MHNDTGPRYEPSTGRGERRLKESPPPRTRLPDALLSPSAYPQRVDTIGMVETHISWVFLAGDRAYKIKKPVELGFLDFSTVESRRHYCGEELRLNRRFAPGLYEGLSRVTRGADDSLAIDGTGPTVDWAVRMRRFDRNDELDRLIERDSVSTAELRDLGERLAAAQADAPAADERAAWCVPERMMTACRETSRDLALLWPEAAPHLAALEGWAEERWRSVEPLQRSRRASGAFRQCHGDLHCANVVRIEGLLTPFDALEFDPGLSWIDPVNDVAFLVMDLDARGRTDLAAAALDGWLARSGDFAGLASLRLFCVYRALVRAMANGIRAAQRPDDTAASAARRRYLDAALRHSAPMQPSLIVMAGVSGSGKSWLAERLLGRLGAIRVRSDVERKRLAGLAPTASSDGRIYAPEFTQRTYGRLGEAATAIIDAGYVAIVDAACLMRAERETLRALADAHRVPFVLVWVTARDEVLVDRIAMRRATGADPSEATVDVLRAQQRFMEAPLPAELERGLWLDTSDNVDVDSVATALRSLPPMGAA